MLKKDAIAHFGSQKALADAIGVKQQSINDWRDVVPENRQLQIHKLTAGECPADPAVLAKYGLPASELAR